MSSLDEVRAELKKRRAAHSTSERLSLSQKACARALEHWKVMIRPQGDLLVGYRPHAAWGELPLDGLLKGRMVAYPRMHGELMEFAVGLEWSKSEFGFEEPAASCPALSTAELGARAYAILIPGLGFGPSGQRIGMGKGHYDRFLPEFATDVPRIAITFDNQVLDEFNSEWEKPWDQRVDWVVTESRVLRGQRVS